MDAVELGSGVVFEPPEPADEGRLVSAEVDGCGRPAQLDVPESITKTEPLQWIARDMYRGAVDRSVGVVTGRALHPTVEPVMVRAGLHRENATDTTGFVVVRRAHGRSGALPQNNLCHVRK